MTRLIFLFRATDCGRATSIRTYLQADSVDEYPSVRPLCRRHCLGIPASIVKTLFFNDIRPSNLPGCSLLGRIWRERTVGEIGTQEAQKAQE